MSVNHTDFFLNNSMIFGLIYNSTFLYFTNDAYYPDVGICYINRTEYFAISAGIGQRFDIELNMDYITDEGESLCETILYVLQRGLAAPDHGYQSTLHHTIIFIMWSIQGTIGIIINTLCILVIRFGKHLEKSTQIQLIHLACVDILYSISVIEPLVTSHKLFYELYNRNLIFCKLSSLIKSTLIATSVLSHSVIGIERFFVVYLPLKMTFYKTKHKLLALAAIWTLGILINIHNVTSRFIVDTGHGPRCRSTQKGELLFSYSMLGLCSVTIGITYTSIAIKLCKKKPIGETTDCQERKQSAQQMRTIRMLAASAVIALITWLPMTIFFLISYDAVEYNLQNIYSWIYVDWAMESIAYTHCFSTPIACFIFNPSFRKDTHDLFKRCYRPVKGFPGVSNAAWICNRVNPDDETQQLSREMSGNAETQL